MFYGCSSLTSINFKNFKTNLVKMMDYMFYGCISLKSLDLSSFDTSSVTVMQNMFSECCLLKSLDLSNFNTNFVKNISYMFNNCYSLMYLELGNFNTSSVSDINNIFNNCTSLKSLNLKSFIFNSINNENMFNNCSTSLQYCINDGEINSSILFQLDNYQKKNCSDLCSLNSNKFIIQKNKCINYCINDDTYKYEYNNICYLSCPVGTYSFNNNNYICQTCEHYFNYNRTFCIETIPLGNYLNDSIHKTIDKCNIKCKNCTLESMSYNLCISCNKEQGYYIIFNDTSNKYGFINCYNQSPIGYYLDTNDSIYKLFLII